jgi:hypothetical protein
MRSKLRIAQKIKHQTVKVKFSNSESIIGYVKKESLSCVK